LLAASVVLAPLALTAWFATCPTFDAGCPDQTHTVAVLADFRNLSASLMRLFLWANVAAPYLYPVSYLGLGLLAMKRAPWLATLGIIFGWAGSIPTGRHPRNHVSSPARHPGRPDTAARGSPGQRDQRVPGIRLPWAVPGLRAHPARDHRDSP
jgi:hypothetical protein